MIRLTFKDFINEAKETAKSHIAKLNIHPVPEISKDSTGREIHTWKAKVVSQDWN